MKRTLLLAALVAASGCSKGAPDSSDGIASRPAVAAPRQISAAFAVVSDANPAPAASALNVTASPKNALLISIKKTALEKEFLLQASLTQYSDTPQWGGLKSRIVAFRERDGALYMLEATQGHEVTRDVPMTLLLAQFPIVTDDGVDVTFDFNAGMSNVFSTGDWYAADEESGAFAHDYKALKTRFSYLESAVLNDRNQLAITQEAQLAGDGAVGGVADNSSVEVRYYLSPYAPSPDFTPVVSKNQDVAGYFAVAPVMQADGSSVVRSAHFNINKPIVFAISANTPAEYKQAVREGVLSWNKFLGDGKMQVVDAPASVTAPDLNYNVVQWMTDDTSGAAYADAQMDPRSGEVLHAQVYMPSAFAYLGKNRLRVMLARKKPAGPRQRVLLTGFESGHLCDFDLADAMAGSADTVAALADAPDADAKALKASQDYVRDVVAHEIGHTLGLRHNFAGSTAVNYPLSQRRQNIETYLETGSGPAGTITTSSIMDYDLFEDDIILGDQIAHGAHVLEYDRMALEMLYLGKTYDASQVPLFCTDGSADAEYADCKRFDAGSSAVEFQSWSDETAVNQFPFMLLEKFVRFSKAPRAGDVVVPVEKVVFDPDNLARQFFAGRQQIYSLFTSATKSFRVRHSYPFVSSLNQDEVRRAELDLFAGDVAKFGGLEKVFSSLPADFSQKAFARFCELLDTRYASGTGPDGKAYSFSATEVSTMKARMRAFFDRLPLSIAKAELWALSGGAPVLPTAKDPKLAGKLEDYELTFDLAGLLEKKFYQYGMAVDEGRDLVASVQIPDPDGKAADGKTPDPKATKTVALTLPTFHYPIEVRVAAAGLLKGERSLAIDWGVRERGRTRKAYSESVQKALGGNPVKAFPGELMPRAVERWILEAGEAADPTSLLGD